MSLLQKSHPAAWFMFSTVEESGRSNSVIYKSQALSGLDALQLLLVMWHGHQPKLSHLSSLSSLLSSVCHNYSLAIPSLCLAML